MVEDGVVLDLSGVGQVIHDGIQQRLHALVLQGTAHQHRREEPLNSGSPDGCLGAKTESGPHNPQPSACIQDIKVRTPQPTAFFLT